MKIVTCLFACFIGCNLLYAQDRIYTLTKTLFDVKVRDNKPDFVEYRFEGDDEKKNYFLDKKEINKIVWKGGFVEDIIHDSLGKHHSVFSYIQSNGDTLKENINYDPAAGLAADPSIKLVRFASNKFYTQVYSDNRHFYLNDPGKKFLNCAEITYMGVNFSYMKLVNYHDKFKAAFIKENHLPKVAGNANANKLVLDYRESFLKGKKLWIDTRASARSFEALDAMSWVSATDYTLPVSKVPAIIRSLNCEKPEGVGIVFIMEKLSKPDKAVAGYWVVFDFATRKALLIDYIHYGKVELQTSTIAGWEGYWGIALADAGVYIPITFQKYLELEGKGKLQLID